MIKKKIKKIKKRWLKNDKENKEKMIKKIKKRWLKNDKEEDEED